ncbi:hypothetical protein V8E53_007472 [Lactarius tabidus]
MYYSTKPSVMHYLVALAFTVGSRQGVLAANDWLAPCLQGNCSWDLPSDSGTSGTLQIWGPTTAISDITSAAGWQITHCDPSATAQDIQLVCPDANTDCDHLFQDGAVDTIVRLPDECGPMPFARVANHWTNQSNTPSSRAITTRASDAEVHSLTLDTNFSAVSPSPNGSVYFTVQGLNGGNGTFTPVVHQRRWFTRRGSHGSRRHVHRRSLFSKILQALQNAMAFNKTISQDLPLSFSGSDNLFNASVDCPGTPSSFTGSVSIDVDGAVQAAISIGAVAAGTIIPPEITEFGLTLGLDGSIDAQFSISANLTGSVSSGAIPLFQIGLPVLSVPGILDVGPEFVLKGKVDVDFTLPNVDASVSIAYNFSEVATTFPQSGSSSGSYNHGTSTVTVSAGQNITEDGASVSVTGHLIPQVDIGLSAFGGIASADVFLNLDASMDLSVSANSGDAQACVDASTGLAVNIGAENSFFDLFDASMSDTLFEKNFPLLQVRHASITRLLLASRR